MWRGHYRAGILLQWIFTSQFPNSLPLGKGSLIQHCDQQDIIAYFRMMKVESTDVFPGIFVKTCNECRFSRSGFGNVCEFLEVMKDWVQIYNFPLESCPRNLHAYPFVLQASFYLQLLSNSYHLDSRLQHPKIRKTEDPRAKIEQSAATK